MKKLKAEMKKSGFRWTIENLKVACNYKKRPKDEKMPTRREVLFAGTTAMWQVPDYSPSNSNAAFKKMHSGRKTA